MSRKRLPAPRRGTPNRIISDAAGSEIIPIERAAKLLGVSVETVARYQHAGLLPYFSETGDRPEHRQFRLVDVVRFDFDRHDTTGKPATRKGGK